MPATGGSARRRLRRCLRSIQAVGATKILQRQRVFHPGRQNDKIMHLNAWSFSAGTNTRISMAETVVILGASTNPGRFSHMAQLALLEHGHTPVPVNPRYESIDGIPCYPDLESVRVAVDTVTVYVRPDILAPMIEDVVRMNPGRVIFNPGSESRKASERLASEGIRVQNACTLVLLDSSRFTI